MADGTVESEPQEMADISAVKKTPVRKSMRKSVADNNMGTPLQNLFKTPKPSVPITESNDEVVATNADITVEGDEPNEANDQNEE